MANYYTPESQPVQTWDYTLNNESVAALQQQLPQTDILSAPFLIGPKYCWIHFVALANSKSPATTKTALFGI